MNKPSKNQRPWWPLWLTVSFNAWPSLKGTRKTFGISDSGGQQHTLSTPGIIPRWAASTGTHRPIRYAMQSATTAAPPVNNCQCKCIHPSEPNWIRYLLCQQVYQLCGAWYVRLAVEEHWAFPKHTPAMAAAKRSIDNDASRSAVECACDYDAKGNSD